MHVLIVDDHAMFREGLLALITREKPETRVSEAGSLEEAQRVLDDAARRPDLVLLDLHLDVQPADEITQKAMKLFSGIPVVALSGIADPRVIRKVVEAGAMGFIPKSLSYAEFSVALTRALAGDVYLPKISFQAPPLRPARMDGTSKAAAITQLTARQMEVLRLLAFGSSNRAIARQLGISEETVKSHLAHIFTTLDVNSRSEAVYLLAQVEFATGPSAVLRA